MSFGACRNVYRNALTFTKSVSACLVVSLLPAMLVSQLTAEIVVTNAIPDSDSPKNVTNQGTNNTLDNSAFAERIPFEPNEANQSSFDADAEYCKTVSFESSLFRLFPYDAVDGHHESFSGDRELSLLIRNGSSADALITMLAIDSSFDVLKVLDEPVRRHSTSFFLDDYSFGSSVPGWEMAKSPPTAKRNAGVELLQLLIFFAAFCGLLRFCKGTKFAS